jgi:hypothetical protein
MSSKNINVVIHALHIRYEHIFERQPGEERLEDRQDCAVPELVKKIGKLPNAEGEEPYGLIWPLIQSITGSSYSTESSSAILSRGRVYFGNLFIF